jgi:hypothetical protein
MARKKIFGQLGEIKFTTDRPPKPPPNLDSSTRRYRTRTPGPYIRRRTSQNNGDCMPGLEDSWSTVGPTSSCVRSRKKNINPQPATSARPRDFLSYQVANSYACTYRIKLGYGKFFVVRPTALALRRCRCASHHTFTESVGFINNYVSIFNDLSATLPAWHDFGSFRQRRSPQLHPS